MFSGSGGLNTPFELVTGLGFAGFVLLLLAMPLAFWAVASQSRAGLVRLLVAVANLLFTAQLILRWWQSGHFPISNLYESLCFLAWPRSPAAGGAGLAVSHRGCRGYTHGAWLHCSPALHCRISCSLLPVGAGLALQLVGDACERDQVSYAALLVISSSLAVLVTDRDQPLSCAAVDRQRWLSAGCFCGQWWFRAAAISSAEHQ